MKKTIILLTLILSLHIVFAEYSYELSNFQKQASVSHSGSELITYKVTNGNAMCAMDCKARIKSSIYNSDIKSFNLKAGYYITLNFYGNAPSKSESNYKESGDVIYDLDIVCKTKESLFPICPAGTEKGNEVGSTEFKLMYELSEADKHNKEQLDRVLDKLKDSLDDVNKELNEVESLYNDAKRKIKLSNLGSDISDIEDDFKPYLSKIESIENYYNKLDFGSGIDIYNSMTYFSQSTFQTRIRNIKNEIEETKEKHDKIVDKINDYKIRLQKYNKETYLFKLDIDYENLISSIESYSKSIEKLSFSSYSSLETNVNSFETKFNSFENKLKDEKDKVTTSLQNSIKNEYNKLDEIQTLNTNLDSYSIIKKYCDTFSNVLPNKFQQFNTKEQEKINQENLNRITRNEEIETCRVKWNELNNITNEIKTISKNKYIDKTLINGCSNSLNQLQEKDFSLEDIENTISKCKEFKTKLIINIEENNGFASSIINFFKNLFSENIVLVEHNLKELDSFKNLKEITFSPVEFSQTSLDLVDKYCDIDIKNINIKLTKEAKSLEYNEYSGGSVANFKINEGECSNNKCYDLEEGYPILFVHGHLFNANDDPMEESINTFDDLISYIDKNRDNSFDAGKIVSAGSENLGSDMAVTKEASLFRTTYYGAAYINSEGYYVWKSSKYESISDYAKKLGEIIDSTLELTNRKKIKIVAHSMGGLVTREYIRKEGKDKIDTFIMIGTPNKGVEGTVAKNCYEGLGDGAETECKEMLKGSSFLTKLNSMSRSSLPEKTYIVAGVYSNKETDGIVLYENTQVVNVKLYKKRSSESYQGDLLEGLGSFLGEDFLHSQLVNPSKTYDVSSTVLELLD